MQVVFAIIVTVLLAVFSFGGDAFSSVSKGISTEYKQTTAQNNTKNQNDKNANASGVKSNVEYKTSKTGYSKNEGTTTAIPKAANRIYGRALYVSDGDTITFQTKQGEKFKIRMYGIDAPEKAQPYGPQSTGILKNLIMNETLNVELFNTDRYGRNVAKIYVGKQDINAEMIRLGAAWHYRAYDKSSSYQQYEDLEKYARQNRKGLWNRDNPTPPWEYRKAMREKK